MKFLVLCGMTSAAQDPNLSLKRMTLLPAFLCWSLEQLRCLHTAAASTFSEFLSQEAC